MASMLLLSACEQKAGQAEGLVSDAPQTPSSQLESSELDLQPEPQSSQAKSFEVKDFKPLPADSFRSIEWTDLMPPEDIKALENPPSYVMRVQEGSEEDLVAGQFNKTITPEGGDAYSQALVSTHVVEAMDGQAIRLPGFIVPLEFDEQQSINLFFLVPFFGACIHMPPPPPNQIILVYSPQGIQLEALYDPFWISGVLSADLQENDLATSAYSMVMHNIEAYQELPPQDYDDVSDEDVPDEDVPGEEWQAEE